MAMIELLYFLAGSLCTIIVSRYYYRRTSTEVPEWAKALIKKLPDQPPSEQELLKLFQESLESGKVKADPLLGHVACPNCKAPAGDFEHRAYSDDSSRGVAVVTCPSCGWSESTDI
ncbi:MAG: hypothetical protein ACHQPI_02875 [Thermoanaerobaculia bacterium]